MIELKWNYLPASARKALIACFDQQVNHVPSSIADKVAYLLTWLEAMGQLTDEVRIDLMPFLFGEENEDLQVWLDEQMD